MDILSVIMYWFSTQIYVDTIFLQEVETFWIDRFWWKHRLVCTYLSSQNLDGQRRTWLLLLLLLLLLRDIKLFSFWRGWKQCTYITFWKKNFCFLTDFYVLFIVSCDFLGFVLEWLKETNIYNILLEEKYTGFLL